MPPCARLGTRASRMIFLTCARLSRGTLRGLPPPADAFADTTHRIQSSDFIRLGMAGQSAALDDLARAVLVDDHGAAELRPLHRVLDALAGRDAEHHHTA